MQCLEQHRLITCQRSASGTRSSNFPSSAVRQNRWRWISPSYEKIPVLPPSGQRTLPHGASDHFISKLKLAALTSSLRCTCAATSSDGLKGGELSVSLSHDRNTKSWFERRRKRRYCSTTRFAAAASRSKAILSFKLSSAGLICASIRPAAAKTRRIRSSVGSGLEMTNLTRPVQDAGVAVSTNLIGLAGTQQPLTSLLCRIARPATLIETEPRDASDARCLAISTVSTSVYSLHSQNAPEHQSRSQNQAGDREYRARCQKRVSCAATAKATRSRNPP